MIQGDYEEKTYTVRDPFEQKDLYQNENLHYVSVWLIENYKKVDGHNNATMLCDYIYKQLEKAEDVQAPGVALCDEDVVNFEIE